MIVKNAIAPALEELVKQCKTGPFSFGCDESNDSNQQKTLAIVVKYDEYCGQVNLMTNKVTKDPGFPLLSRLATACSPFPTVMLIVKRFLAWAERSKQITGLIWTALPGVAYSVPKSMPKKARHS